MSTKNDFSIHGDTVYIKYPTLDKLAFAPYHEDFYKELISCTWRFVNRGTKAKPHYYATSNKFGDLHRYIMEKGCGKDIVKGLVSDNYVIDHLNNNGLDCRFENLTFLPRNENLAKGLTLDKKIVELRPKIALSIYRDVTNNNHQITIFFNKQMFLLKNNQYIDIIALRLLYENSPIFVIADAKSILDNYEANNRIDLLKLHFIDMRYEKAEYIELTEEEQQNNSGFVIRDGHPVMVLNGKNLMLSIPMNKDWLATKKQ